MNMIFYLLQINIFFVLFIHFIQRSSCIFKYKVFNVYLEPLCITVISLSFKIMYLIHFSKFNELFYLTNGHTHVRHSDNYCKCKFGNCFIETVCVITLNL